MVHYINRKLLFFKRFRFGTSLDYVIVIKKQQSLILINKTNQL
jgi:hypothetical protein